MFTSFATLAAIATFATSASAITVTFPGPGNPWTNDGLQTVKWTSVNTDAANFTILLTNTNTTLIPTVDNNQQLKALVDTSDGSTTVGAPANGWPSPGSNYRINLVASAEETSTIYAQSQPFDIVAASSSSSSASSTSKATQATTPNTVASQSETTDSSDASPSASDSSSGAAATGSSGALSAMSVHHGFFGATLVLLGALLA